MMRKMSVFLDESEIREILKAAAQKEHPDCDVVRVMLTSSPVADQFDRPSGGSYVSAEIVLNKRPGAKP